MAPATRLARHPTWIAAFAALGFLIGAIITASCATKAFGKQSDEELGRHHGLLDAVGPGRSIPT